MQTRSSSKLSRDQTSNLTSSTNTTPKGRTRRSSKQKVENSNFEEHLPPVVTMADNRTMAEMLRAPTEGCAEAIVVPPILAEQFELKHSLINMMTSEQFFGLETDNPHDHIYWFNKITSTIKYRDVPNSMIKLILFPFSLKGTARWWLEKEPPHQDSLNAAAGGNLLEKSPQNALTIIENKSKVRNSRSKPIASQVKACDINSSSEIAKLTHAVNQQTSAVTTAMMAMLKQLQATPPPAPVKAVKEICVTCEGAHPYYQCLAAGGNTFPEFRDNIQVVLLLMDLPFPLLPNSVTLEVGECVEETYTDQDLAEYTIKVPPPPVQKYKPPSQRDFVVHKRDPLHPNIPYPSRMLKQKQQKKDEYQKMLKALLSNKEKLQELANTLLNENCSAVILKKLPEKLGDPGKFLIPCGFSELKCKALADLGASINLMPLSIWKELGLPDLIPTRMTLELANHAIRTPDGIARDVFVLVGKFTFPTDFVIVDYESDPRVTLILGRPFLRTARALIDIHGEEIILRDGDERLTLNMKHDTASYSNQPHRESVNLINIFNVLSEDCLEVSVLNKPSGNPTFSLHQVLNSPEVTHGIHDSEGCNFSSEELPDIDSFNDIHPYFDDNPLSGSTTHSSNSLLEEFTDELALITYPSDYDDNLQFDIESDLKEIEFLLYQGKDSGLKDSIVQTDLANLDDYFVDPIPEMFTDEHTPDYSSPPRFDVYDDDFLEVESDADNVYDDPFDSKGEKIKESKLLIDELDLPCDFLPCSEYDSFNSQDFSKDDDLPSTDNEDKDKKIAISNASLVFEDFDPPFYEPRFFKDVPKSKMLLLFSSENEEKVFKPGIYTSEKAEAAPVVVAPIKSGKRYKCLWRKRNRILKMYQVVVGKKKEIPLEVEKMWKGANIHQLNSISPMDEAEYLLAPADPTDAPLCIKSDLIQDYLGYINSKRINAMNQEDGTKQMNLG
nr:reverse transcriptase domain-containing protein [Tanacetum cinerariifolium]